MPALNAGNSQGVPKLSGPKGSPREQAQQITTSTPLAGCLLVTLLVCCWARMHSACSPFARICLPASGTDTGNGSSFNQIARRRPSQACNAILRRTYRAKMLCLYLDYHTYGVIVTKWVQHAAALPAEAWTEPIDASPGMESWESEKY